MEFLKRMVIITITFTFMIPLFSCSIYKAARDERSIGTYVDDKKIALDIKYQLLNDDRVKDLDISVYSFLGKVYLVGVVESAQQVSQATEMARKVKGVKAVNTYLLDKKGKTIDKSFDDTDLTAKVKSRLKSDEDIKSTQIEVKTILGHVVLLGIVGSSRERDKAIAHAKSVKYVKKVKSFITVW